MYCKLVPYSAATANLRLQFHGRLQCLLYMLRNRSVHGLETATIFNNRKTLYGEVDVALGAPPPDVFVEGMFELVRFCGVSAAGDRVQRREDQRLFAQVHTDWLPVGSYCVCVWSCADDAC
jgi:hypothetical protein